MRHQLPVDVNLALRDLLQPVHAADQSALARTARPDDDQLLALGHFQINAFEHFQMAKRLMHIPELNHRFAPHLRRASLRARIFVFAVLQRRNGSIA